MNKKTSNASNLGNYYAYSGYSASLAPSCGLSSGYYFSSGSAVRQTYYSGVGNHGPVWNIASRIVVDGGRKAIATAAMAGMFVQNLELPLYATPIAMDDVGENTTSTVAESQEISSVQVSGTNALLNVYGIANYTSILQSGTMAVYSGNEAVVPGAANSTYVYSGGLISVYNGGIANDTAVYYGGSFGIAGSASGVQIESGARLDILEGANVQGIIQSVGGIVNADVISGATRVVSGVTLLSTGSHAFSLNGNTANDFIVYSGGEQHIQSGGTANRTILSSGGVQHIELAGMALSTTISNGAYASVYGGGIIQSAEIKEGGKLYVRSGGIAINISQAISANVYADVVKANTTYISGKNASGADFSLSNGIANDFILYSGGSQIVSNGGIANRTIVHSGATQTIYAGSATSMNVSGGTVSLMGADSFTSSGYVSAAIISGGSIDIGPFGYAYGVYVLSGGMMVNSAGFTDSSYISNARQIVGVSSGDVLIPAIASRNSLYIGATQEVYNGGSAIDNYLFGYNRQTVYSGGFAKNTNITVVESNYGGIQNISGGSALSNYITSGTQNIYSGGIAESTYLSSGASQYVYSSALASKTTINSGAAAHVYSGGNTKDATVKSGGVLEIGSGGSASGIVQSEGGRVLIGTIQNGDTRSVSGVYSSGIAPAASFALYTLSGQTSASNFIISSGDSINAQGGVHIQDTVVKNGGSLVIQSNAVASGATISSGAVISIASGGSASGIVQKDGGNVQVDNVYANDTSTNINGTNAKGSAFSLNNGLAQNFVLYSGGSLRVNSDARADGTDIRNGGLVYIYSGASASVANVSSGGMLHIYSGGYATNIVQKVGGNIGVEAVYGGDTDTYVSGTNALGSSFYLSNGIASGFVLYDKDSPINVYSGGYAAGTVLNSGTRLFIDSGGSASGTVVSNKGIVYVRSSGYAHIASQYAGGIIQLDSGIRGGIPQPR